MKENDNAGPVAAMEAATAENYLGSPRVVSTLIKTWIGSALEAVENGIAPDELVTQASASARELAGIFLGNNPNYRATEFNRPGGIDQFLRENCGIADKDPTDAVQNALLKCFRMVMEVLVENQGRVESDFDWKIAGIMETFFSMFLGVLDPVEV